MNDRVFPITGARPERLRGLVNDAGVVDVSARLDAMDLARWRRMFDVNVIGSLLCAREAVRRMRTRHGGAGGAIVNVSSAASRLGSPGQYVDDAAAKGAIDSFTIGLAREVAAEGIRVNAVRPGLIDTEVHTSGGLPDRVGCASLRPRCPCSAAAAPRRWHRPLSGCSRTRRATPPRACSTSRTGDEFPFPTLPHAL